MVSGHVLTLVNSIIGVSVLLMPYCFKQCGIILGTLMLLSSSVLTRLLCYFLLKAATMTKRRNYELLAYHTYGSTGKLLVEIAIIGYLIGTLIAFLVLMGDLAPELISNFIPGIKNDDSLRTIIMLLLSIFVALPLGLLKNVDSLITISAASLLFYAILVFKLLNEGIDPLLSGDFINKIEYWKPSGILQTMPIFAMSLSCQTQIFPIYESLSDPNIQKMMEIVKFAVNLCTVLYFCVGFLGYIAFENFGGNILLVFPPGWSSQVIKFSFLLSVAFSFPILIFPCRASLHSLLFKRTPMHHLVHDISVNFIPESRLKILTVLIVAFTLVMGLIIPNIEFVLGLVGSTMGAIICIIFPSMMFIQVIQKNTTERLLAQCVFAVGILIMVLSSYATLVAVDTQSHEPIIAQDDNPRVTEIINSIKLGRIEDSLIDKKYEVSPPKIDAKIGEFKLKKLEDERIDDSKVDQVNQPETNVKYENLKKEDKDDPLPEPPEIPDKGPKDSDQGVNNLQDGNEKERKDSEKNNLNKIDQNPEGVGHKPPLPAGPAQPKVIKETNQEKKLSEERENNDEILKRLEQHQIEQRRILEEQEKILKDLKQNQKNDAQDGNKAEEELQKKEINVEKKSPDFKPPNIANDQIQNSNLNVNNEIKNKLKDGQGGDGKDDIIQVVDGADDPKRRDIKSAPVAIENEVVKPMPKEEEKVKKPDPPHLEPVPEKKKVVEEKAKEEAKEVKEQKKLDEKVDM